MKAMAILLLSIFVGLLSAFLIGPMVNTREGLFFSMVLVIIALVLVARLNGSLRLISPLTLYIGFSIVMIYIGTVAISLGYKRPFTVVIDAYPVELGMSLVAVCVGAYIVEWYTYPSIRQRSSRYLARSIDDTLEGIPRWILTNGYLILGTFLTAMLFVNYGVIWTNVAPGESYANITSATNSFSIKSLYLLGLTMFLPIGSLARFAMALKSRRRSDYVFAAGTAGLVLLGSTLAGVRHIALDYLIWAIILFLLLGFRSLPRFRILLISGFVSLILMFAVIIMRNPDLQKGNPVLMVENSFIHVFGRISISQAEAFNFQLDYIPRVLPYFDGMTYFDRLQGAIPGISPQFDLATWLSRNSRTGVDFSNRGAPYLPPTFAGEAYSNFGLTGMLIGSLVWGAFLHWVWKVVLALPRRLDYAILASIAIANLGRSAILSAYSPVYNSVMAAVLILGPGILLLRQSNRDSYLEGAHVDVTLNSRTS